MRDCRLSEIKSLCVKHIIKYKYCNNKCAFYSKCYDMCGQISPCDWQIDKPIKDPSKDDIILTVKKAIGSFGTLDKMTETLTFDCSDIDNIAEMIAEKFFGGEEWNAKK